MNQSIVKFIKSQTCATICCINENNDPYCFSCFYAFDIAQGLLYFKSSFDTEHIKILQQNPIVAGAILPDKFQRLIVQGIQFYGKLMAQNDDKIKISKSQYYKRFPFALAIPGEVWIIEIENIKMTDSTKGFGHKTTWNKNINTLS